MNIEPTSRLSPLSPAPGPSTPVNWQVGAVMRAHVVGRHNDGRMTLLVDQEEVLADVPPGAALPRAFRVRVTRSGSRPQLEMVDDHDSDEAFRMRALLSLVPRQAGLGALMAELQPVLDASGEGLSSDVATALTIVDSTIPTADAFANAASTAKVLGNAGLSLESRLAHAVASRNDAVLVGDWKAALARLVGALHPYPAVAAADACGDLPPPLPAQDLPRQPRAPRLPSRGSQADWGRLRNAAQGVLARIEIAQLQTQGRAPAWLFELPMRGRGGFDVLQIRVAPAPGNQAGGDDKAWSISLAMDLPALGAIGAEVDLRGNRIRVSLWAELSAVARRIEASLATLAGALQAHGLVVEHVACRYGSPERPPASSGGLLSATA